ncbi:hypothetical protein IQ250_22235 [Pseudanabaenaceae cyanobacterium LEGE 13415]|nr:hypothetical protein [Pseudanabaenaceae cyanobacterium LEGE 13415]
MQIELYFQQIQETISNCPVVESFDLKTEKRDVSIGFVRAEIQFRDFSVLAIREFVSVETSLDRDMYSYQYMSAENQLIFRYDNTGHHKKLNLPTYPNHKPEGSEENVIASLAPTLSEVLDEITELIRSSP